MVPHDKKLEISFIIGCARSGTSILGELIASHPKVKYIFEAHRIWEKAGLGENNSHRLTEKQAKFFIKRYIRSWFSNQATNGQVLVEKCPRNALRVPFIKTIFPEAKIIHIFRDGRDVACSLMPGIGGEDWNHLKPPSWKNLVFNSTGLERCAKAWRDVIEITTNDLEDIPHLSLKYEDLLLDTERTVRTIMKYLNLSFDYQVALFSKKISNSTKKSYHAQRQKDWYKNDHLNRIGRWKENLTVSEQKDINVLLSDWLSRLGYN